MTITLSNLKPKFGSKHQRKTVGRGNASGHGTYSGRGQKGQRARSGGKKGLKLKGLKSMLKQIPKIGGFVSRYPRTVVVNLNKIERKFESGEVIGPKKLVEAGLIENKSGKVKILAKGKLSKKFTIKAHAFSQAAIKSIEKAGGQAIKI